MRSTGGGSTAQRLGDVEGKAPCGGGSDRGYGCMLHSYPSAVLHGLPGPVWQPHFPMGLACQPGIQLLGTASHAVTADGAGTECGLTPAGALPQPRMEHKLGHEKVTQTKWSIQGLQRITKHFLP